MSLRTLTAVTGAALVVAACGTSAYAVRPVPTIVAQNVGQPVSRLQDTFGEPRKIERNATRQVYVWYLPTKVKDAPEGFHGCEMEVTVDSRSQRVLGYSLSNLGWSECKSLERRVRKHFDTQIT
jgi:hypothetical protein